MDNDASQMFLLNFKRIVIEEIALDGLDGITLQKLWVLLEKRISKTITDKLKTLIWKFILGCEDVSFYVLPVPRENFVYVDRLSIIEETVGFNQCPDPCLDGPYEYCPVKNEYGSCQYYNERLEIQRDSSDLHSLKTAEDKYGNRLVLVASQKERFYVLSAHDPDCLKNFTQMQYCLLELIGRARENGQTTVGVTNLHKISKDPKNYCYLRVHLEKHGVIRSSTMVQTHQGIKRVATLMRLKRFHRPRHLNVPTVGAFGNLVKFLRTQPNFTSDYGTLLKKKILTAKVFKKVKKNMVLKVDQDDPKNSKKQMSEARLVRLNTESDCDDSSDEEDAESVKCEYKVGVSLYRQAYELFLEAGPEGLGMVELCRKLSMGFYAARRIFKLFTKRNIVREVHVDRNKVKRTRYVAIAAAAGKDREREEEKKKILQFYQSKPEIIQNNDETEVPAKRPRIEEAEIEKNAITIHEIPKDTQSFIKSLDNKRPPPLRHLKYASAALKITRKKLAVAGYLSLSLQISNDLKIHKMDWKAFEKILNKIVADGQMKVYNLKWPTLDKVTRLICSPAVDIDHPILKDKYREMCLRTIINHKVPETPKGNPDNVVVSYRRYLKARKLHEFVYGLVHEHGCPTDMPSGFISLLEMLPEMTVELAVGMLNKTHCSKFLDAKLTDKLRETKLKDAPKHLFRSLCASKNLQTTLVRTLTMLASFGLVQMCNRANIPLETFSSHFLKYIFYVNKNAKLVNTTGEWPRDDAETIHFRFDSKDDVFKYWNTLYEIAINTIVNDRPSHGPRIDLPKVTVYNEEGASERDDARLVTDGRGAAGLHSIYHINNKTYWFKNFEPTHAKLGVTKLAIAKLPQQKLAKLKFKKVPRKPQKLPKTILKELLKPPQDSKRRFKKPPVKEWTEYEDEIVYLCKTGAKILSPVPQLGMLIIRNSVAKTLLNDSKRSVAAYNRRFKEIQNVKEMESLIDDFKATSHYDRYSKVLNGLRRKYMNNLNTYLQEAKLILVNLVWLLYQVKHRKQKITPCVSIDIESFRKDFDITVEQPEKLYDLYTCSSNIEDMTLKEAIIMSLFLTSGDNDGVSLDASLSLYQYLLSKTEEVVKIPVQELRRVGIMVLIKKNVLHTMKPKDCFSSTIKAYGLSRSSDKKLSGVPLNAGLAGDVTKALYDKMTSHTTGKVHSNCLIFESMCRGDVSLALKTDLTMQGDNEMREERMNDNDIDQQFNLKSGKVALVHRPEVEKMADFFEELDYEKIYQELVNESLIPAAKPRDVSEDAILQHLKGKTEGGASFEELQSIWTGDTDTLIVKLQDLEHEHIIKRVGYYDNVIVLTEFADPWSIQFLDHRVMPAPWLQEQLTICKKVLLKLSGFVLNRVLQYQGSSILKLAIDCEFIASRHIQSICMFLESIQCVTMNVLVVSEPDLFSTDVNYTVNKYNKYEKHSSIAVFATKDAVSRYCFHRKAMLNEQE